MQTTARASISEREPARFEAWRSGAHAGDPAHETRIHMERPLMTTAAVPAGIVPPPAVRKNALALALTPAVAASGALPLRKQNLVDDEFLAVGPLIPAGMLTAKPQRPRP